MAVLLIAEVNAGELALDATARALTAARLLGEVTVLCASGDAAVAAGAAARLDGVVKVLCASDAAYAHGSAEALTALVCALADGFDTFVAAAGALGKSLMPRLAAVLDVMVIPDVVAVVDARTFERPIYAGNAIQTVRSTEAKRVLTVRASAFSPATTTDTPAQIDAIAAAAPGRTAEWVDDTVVLTSRPELASARIVVAGGRALGSAEGFKKIEALADALGAAVGASRAAVDAGYAPNDLQVGQTGKVVAPELYIAVGISGAIQHLAGMKESRVIVAINTDPDAPIFRVADYGLVADLLEVLPELERAVRARRHMPR